MSPSNASPYRSVAWPYDLCQTLKLKFQGIQVMLWSFLSQKKRALFLHLLETVPWCVLQQFLMILAQLYVAKALTLCLTLLRSISVRMQSGTTGRCYLTKQSPLGQTVLVSALVLPCEQRFPLAWLLTFTKSFASHVCRVVNCFYMMSSDFTFLFRGLYHITPKSNRNGNEKETGADVCPATKNEDP